MCAKLYVRILQEIYIIDLEPVVCGKIGMQLNQNLLLYDIARNYS